MGYVFGKFGKDFEDLEESYRSENPCCLMAGAGFSAGKGVLYREYPQYIAESFSLSYEEFWEIINGFDGDITSDLAKNSYKIREVLCSLN